MKKVFFGFAAGQGLSQIATFASGLLVLWNLETYQYAIYILASAYTAVTATLLDLGATSAVISLSGRSRGASFQASLYWAATRLRTRIVIAAALIVWLFLESSSWHNETQLSIFAYLLAITVTANLTAAASVTGAFMRLDDRYQNYYQANIEGSIGRLAMFGLALYLGASAALVFLALNLLHAFYIYIRMEMMMQLSLADKPKRMEIIDATEKIISYIKPLVPGVIFSSLQGQVLVLLADGLGGSREIAQVGALTRISQIFNGLSLYNTTVLEPRIAKVIGDSKYIAKKSIEGVVFPWSAVVAMVVLAFVYPELYVVILGQKYNDLAPNVPIFVLGCALHFFAGSAWSVCSARAWTSLKATFGFIVLVTTVQTVVIYVMGTSSILAIVAINLATGAATFIFHVTTISKRLIVNEAD